MAVTQRHVYYGFKLLIQLANDPTIFTLSYMLRYRKFVSYIHLTNLVMRRSMIIFLTIVIFIDGIRLKWPVLTIFMLIRFIIWNSLHLCWIYLSMISVHFWFELCFCVIWYHNICYIQVIEEFIELNDKSACLG